MFLEKVSVCREKAQISKLLQFCRKVPNESFLKYHISLSGNIMIRTNLQNVDYNGWPLCTFITPELRFHWGVCYSN